MANIRICAPPPVDDLVGAPPINKFCIRPCAGVGKQSVEFCSQENSKHPVILLLGEMKYTQLIYPVCTYKSTPMFLSCSLVV